MNKYFVTIAKSGGINHQLQIDLRLYFASKYDHVVLNFESHKSGLIHLHAVVESSVKSSGAVRKPLVRFLESLEVEVGPKTVVVKSANDGALSYVIKEVSEDSPVTLCQGWSIADLVRKRQEALKRLSRQQILGNDKVVCQDEAVPLIIKFAKGSATPITDKTSFIAIIKEMTRMGFSFSRVKKQDVYAEVMCRLGDDRAVDDLWEMALCGLN